MVLGHIYIVDLKKTNPFYVIKLQEFLNLFGGKTGWATQARSNGTLEIGVRNGKLDSDLHSYFFLRCKVKEMYLSQGKSMLMFPNEDLGNVNKDTDPVKPGEAPREEAQPVQDPGMIEALKNQIDQAKGRA